LAEELASRAISAAPANPYWLLPLLQVLSVEVETSETADQKLVAEKKVYGLFQHFNDIAVDPAARTLLLPLLADLAFDVKDNEAAKTYATQALDLASEHGDRTIQGIAVGPAAVHDANDVLGRIALHSGDMQEAKAYLLKAAAPSGANTMGRVGPRMLLAQMLFDRGERQVVLQYLQNLKTSWKSGSFLLDHWIAAIRLGKSVRLNHVDAPILGVPAR
jgi:tetratricopeptide (TPR) repeat protein